MPSIAAIAIAMAAAVQASAASAPFPVEVDPGGCRLERIAGIDGENHVLFHGVSPDGRQLAVGWDRKPGAVTERGAYLVDLATGARRDLPGLNNAASFSPDGRKLIAANYPGPHPRELKTDLAELDLATGETRPVASHEAMEWLASYGPDGRWAVFNSMRTGASDLYRVDLATGTLTQLTDDPRYEAHAQVSRDGKRVIFHRQIEGDDYGLAILDLATGKVTEIPGSRYEEAYPAWSRNGRWLSYSSDVGQKTGAGDIYVVSTQGGAPRRLTAHAAKDAYSTWSPDGRHLYFMSARDEGVRVYRLEMTGGDCRRG